MITWEIPPKTSTSWINRIQPHKMDELDELVKCSSYMPLGKIMGS